jgi:hypothetical protein
MQAENAKKPQTETLKSQQIRNQEKAEKLTAVS